MSDQIRDVEMSDELRERLKSFDPITPSPTFKYVPKIYREKDESGQYFIPKENWPVFILKSLTGKDTVSIDCVGTDENGNRHVIWGKLYLETVKKGLRSWTNWRDSNGKTIPFDRKTYLDILPEHLYIELTEAIDRRSELSEEELQGL